VRLRRGPATPSTTESSHRVAATVLVVLGALCILISTVSVWVRDIALDSEV
jgi:hypothetical protein